MSRVRLLSFSGPFIGRGVYSGFSGRGCLLSSGSELASDLSTITLPSADAEMVMVEALPLVLDDCSANLNSVFSANDIVSLANATIAVRPTDASEDVITTDSVGGEVGVGEHAHA